MGSRLSPPRRSGNGDIAAIGNQTTKDQMFGIGKKSIEQEVAAQIEAISVASVVVGVALELGVSGEDTTREQGPLFEARARRLGDPWILGYCFGYAQYCSQVLQPTDVEARSVLIWFFFKQLLGDAKGGALYDVALSEANKSPRDEVFRSGGLVGASEAERFGMDESPSIALMERTQQATAH